jgi:hypothetical protein
MNEISKVRFDALAAYCRQPEVALVAKELRWFEFADERVLATLLLDTIDNQFVAIILAPDLREQYRWIGMTDFVDSPDEAPEALARKVNELLPTLEADRVQGDEQGPPVDFFHSIGATDKLNPAFVRLATDEKLSPARGIIEPMMRWYEDADGKFVEQFQTTGFDARIWELYLFATLTEAGHIVDRSFNVPDFVANGLLGELCVEATTVNPTPDARGNVVPIPPTDTPEQELSYVRDYLPIRYAGPLTAKLGKRYWDQPHVTGKPLVFAIQDFHAPASMTWSRPGLPDYLYGLDHEVRREPSGSLTIVPHKIDSHQWGTKEVESGFFMLPEAENVSAVMFNSSATIWKFNRIGVMAGFGSGHVRLVRGGLVVDHDPNASVPKSFVRAVDRDYTESWVEGMDVYHNPNAKYPLNRAMVKGAAHHRLLDDGQIESITPKWQPLTSGTRATIADID